MGVHPSLYTGCPPSLLLSPSKFLSGPGICSGHWHMFLFCREHGFPLSPFLSPDNSYLLLRSNMKLFLRETIL